MGILVRRDVPLRRRLRLINGKAFDHALELRKAGHGVPHIAHEIGMAERTVWKWWKKLRINRTSKQAMNQRVVRSKLREAAYRRVGGAP